MGRGLIQGLVIGVAFLVISIIIAFVVVSNVATVDDGIYTTSATQTVTNETLTTVTASGEALTATGYTGAACTFGYVTNATGGEIITSANYTTSGCTIYANAAAQTVGYNNTDWNVSYTFTYHTTEDTADNMISNFTSGVSNVSGKIPTVLLIAAVVLILGILVLLWQTYKRMGVDSGGASV